MYFPSYFALMNGFGTIQAVQKDLRNSSKKGNINKDEQIAYMTVQKYR